MNWVPRFPPHIPEGAVRLHYESVASGAGSAIWRRRNLIVAIAGISLILGLLVLLAMNKTYTADALIQLDFGREDPSRAGPSTQPAGPALDAAALVESEARVLRSRAIARRVVDRLDLNNDPAFAPRQPLTDWLLSFVQTPPAQDEVSIRSDLIALALIRHLAVTNDTRAYLIGVAYTSGDAARSATIVNAFTDEYLRNRLEAGLNASQRTSGWLSMQIKATRAALDEAEASMNAYRQTSAAQQASAEGAAASERQVADIAGRLDAARRARADEEAKLAYARAVLASGTLSPEGVTAGDLRDPALVRQLLDEREALKGDLTSFDGKSADPSGRDEVLSRLDDVQARFEAELHGAIAERAQEVKAASALEAAFSARLAELRETAAEAKAREARLRSLQLDAASLRDRLKLLTESYSQAVAAAGLKSASAQVVMRADPIPIASGPNPFLILGVSLIGGVGAGMGLSLLLERRQTGFRSEADLSADTQLPCFAMIPACPAVPKPAERRIIREAVDLACAMLGLPAASGSTRVVLVTSSLPQEGKSGFSLALAEAMARKGLRTLIIDPMPLEAGGEGEHRPSLGDVLRHDPAAFLDGATDQPIVALRASVPVAAAELQAGGRVARLVQAAKSRFHVVLLEAPPVMLSLDFLPLAGLADTTVHLVRWNKTPRRTVVGALKRLEALSVAVRGLVLTEIDLDEHKTYSLVDQCHYYSNYRRFYERREAGSRNHGARILS